ncbi:MAG: DUF2330 domain-containing protein [bacterium]
MKRLTLCTLLFLVTLPSTTWAFCGFFVAPGDTKLVNNATRVALMRHETTTVMSLQPDYQGPPEEFAMVIPVPQILAKEDVKTLDPGVFDALDQFSSPRMAEYWEQNPCPVPRTQKSIPSGNINYLSDTSAFQDQQLSSKPYVKVEAQFAVGEYDIVILNSNDASALETWLVDQKYNIPAGAAPYLAPYIASGKYFFVAKVDPKRARFAGKIAVLSPLRFNFTSDDFSLPIRLGMINADGEQDIIVFVLGEDRYVPANYPHAPIPTNIVVKNTVRDQFAGFYEGLYQKARKANEDAIITEYVWEIGNVQRGQVTQGIKCDPCTSPVQFFKPEWLVSLGLDVFGLGSNAQASPTKPGPKSSETPVEQPKKLVLTRLHGRFKSNDENPDIFFQKAVPLVGGMGTPDQNAKLAQTQILTSGTNRFQGRYVLLNPWKGKIQCKDPRRGIWGGPADQGQPTNLPTAGGARFGGKKQQSVNPKKFATSKINYAPPKLAQ